jgi:hypothetical protein
MHLQARFDVAGPAARDTPSQWLAPRVPDLSSSQANTAKVLADNPTLMRLRELEVLEKVATSGKLSVGGGEKGLADRVVNLL